MMGGDADGREDQRAVGELGFGAVGRAVLAGGQLPGMGSFAVVSSSPWSLAMSRLCSPGRARSSVAVTYW